MPTQREDHYIVVGAGVFGASTALHLARLAQAQSSQVSASSVPAKEPGESVQWQQPSLASPRSGGEALQAAQGVEARPSDGHAPSPKCTSSPSMLASQSVTEGSTSPSTIRVTVLDRSVDGFAAPDAASHDLNKIVRADYTDDYYRRLAKRTISIWRSSPLYSRFYHDVGLVFLSGPSPEVDAEGSGHEGKSDLSAAAAAAAEAYAEQSVARALRRDEEPDDQFASRVSSAAPVVVSGASRPRERAHLLRSPRDALACFPPSFSRGASGHDGADVGEGGELGVDVECLGRRASACSPGDVGGAAGEGDAACAGSGYFNSRGGWAEAERATRATLREAQRLGVDVVGGAEVAELLFQDGSEEAGDDEARTGRAVGGEAHVASRRCVGVRTSDGRRFHTAGEGKVILCVGSWATQLLQRLVSPSRAAGPDAPWMRVPCESSAQTVMTLRLDERERRIFKDVPVVMNYQSGFYVFEPNDEGLMKIAIHSDGYDLPRPPLGVPASRITYPGFYDAADGAEDDADANGTRIPRGHASKMLQYLGRIYPQLTRPPRSESRPGDATRRGEEQRDATWAGRVVSTRVCWYSDPWSADENWLIDEVPGLGKSVVVCTGCAGHAFKFLPVLGELVLARLGLPSVPAESTSVVGGGVPPVPVQRGLDEHEARVFSWKHHQKHQGPSGRPGAVTDGTTTDETKVSQPSEAAATQPSSARRPGTTREAPPNRRARL